MQPLVTIIVPIYNVEKYINKCLKSIINQTYKKIEIILIDDGSTDKSSSITDKYANKYKNITVIHTTNQGLSKARNKGLNIANGDWVAFVDSDDYLKRNYISKLLNTALSNNADIATCRYEIISDNDKHKTVSKIWGYKKLTGKQAAKLTFENRWTTDIWLNLFNINIFKNNQLIFPEGREYESISVKIKALYSANYVAFTDTPLYVYRLRAGSITHKAFTNSIYFDKINSLREIEAIMNEQREDKTNNYYNYFKYGMINSILNDIPKRNASMDKTKNVWEKTRNKLLRLYPDTKFPNRSVRTYYRTLLTLSSNRYIYYYLFKLIKLVETQRKSIKALALKA